MTVDAHELDGLATVFFEAAAVAPADARAVIKRGAQNIKTGAQARVRGSQRLPHLAAAITYDSHETPTGAWAEIGPDHERRQGSLGHILEDGTPHTPPRPYMAPEGRAEEPKTAKALEDAAVKRVDR